MNFVTWYQCDYDKFFRFSMYYIRKIFSIDVKWMVCSTIFDILVLLYLNLDQRLVLRWMWTFRLTHFQSFYIFSQSLSYRKFLCFFRNSVQNVISYLAAQLKPGHVYHNHPTSLQFSVRICWVFLYKRHIYRLID